VTRGSETLVLTRTEFALLELFLRNPKQVLTRSVIFDRVWGYDFGYGSELARTSTSAISERRQRQAALPD